MACKGVDFCRNVVSCIDLLTDVLDMNIPDTDLVRDIRDASYSLLHAMTLFNRTLHTSIDRRCL